MEILFESALALLGALVILRERDWVLFLRDFGRMLIDYLWGFVADE